MSTAWREWERRVWGHQAPDLAGIDPAEHEDVVERKTELGAAERERFMSSGFHGAHAAAFVRLAQGFKATIAVSVGHGFENAKRRGNGREGGSVDAKSIFGVTRFTGVPVGHPFWIRARGPDAREAVDTLADALEFRHKF